MSYHISKKTEDAGGAVEFKQNKSRYAPDEQGYYGKFGGAYIPEMLHRNVEELRTRYLEIMNEASFQKEYQQLLQDYVGRPTPLYFAERL
ncbi:MAG TPA: hypothetical protein VL095_01185, partial [Flavisolibacter sp.]|nr:hypothetical protein [Flavisolibacter sp.]